MRNAICAFVVAMLLGAVSPSGVAGEKPEWRDWPLGQRLHLSVSGYRPKLNTEIASGRTKSGSAIIGVLDFESDLGLEDRKTTPIVDLTWRIAKRHDLTLSYFDLNRANVGSPSVNFTLVLDNGSEYEFGVGAGRLPEVRSRLGVKVYDVAYNYAIVFDEKKRWSVGIGLSWQDFVVGLADPGDPDVAVEKDVDAPLPTFNTSFSYAFSDKWLLDLEFGWFDVNLDLKKNGEFDGEILRWGGGIRWQTFPNVGLSLGFQGFDVSATLVEDGYVGEVEYDYRGPRLGIDAYF